MSEPERPYGWPDDAWNDFLAGWHRNEIAARVLTPMHPEPAGENPAAMTEPELRAQALIAESDRLDASARLRMLTDAEKTTVTVTDRPGLPPSVQERRAWALEQALQSGTVVIRPGDGPPKTDFLLTTPEGTVQVTKRQAMPQMTVITPDNAAAVDRWFGARHREWENNLLVSKFGEKTCRKSGLIP